MGQKVNPHGARVGVIFNWAARWYACRKLFNSTGYFVEDNIFGRSSRIMTKKRFFMQSQYEFAQHVKFVLNSG